MRIDVYSMTGEKSGTAELPPRLFEAPINEGLMHLAVMLQQSNRRRPIAHAKTRGEVVGSTRKIFQQKGTGRARRGPIRTPIMKGGGRAFGPSKERNFRKEMPRGQRHAALFSSLSLQAKAGKILGLEAYGADCKTKTFFALLQKLPVAIGRKIVVVLPQHLTALERGSRNVPGVKTLLAAYLNPEDVLTAHHIVFLVEALRVAEETFGGRSQRIQKNQKKQKNNAVGLGVTSSKTRVKTSSESSVSSDSSDSSPASSTSSKKHP